MASLIRLGAIRALKSGLVQPAKKNLKVSVVPSLIRLINTSSKPKQSSSSAVAETSTETGVNKDENWISWGFYDDDEWLDRFLVHSTLFCTISVVFVLGGTMLVYAPDLKQVDWTQREAYLRIRYREDLGLNPIDPELIDLSKFELPSDEELGDTEIII